MTAHPKSDAGGTQPGGTASGGFGMGAARPTIAVVPFGAHVAMKSSAESGKREARPGAWARQIARRLVERFAGNEDVELRPVFLVAMPEADDRPGYLVFGSTPDAALAASYGASLGTTHVLVGTYRESGPSRSLDATLVHVARKQEIARLESSIAPSELHLIEPELARWLVTSLGVAAHSDLDAPGAATEEAYAALLEGMDEEVNATLLRSSDPDAAAAADARAAHHYLEALRVDPGSTSVEERLLVQAAAAIERGDEARYVDVLEHLMESRPRSWRAHYMLGELRRLSGDAAGAIVALEHADSLRPLGDADVIRLAELYAQTGASASAAARLRRVGKESDQYARAQELVAALAAQRGDLSATVAALDRAVAAGADAAARVALARALIASGATDRALRELEAAILAGGAVAAQGRRLRLGLRSADLERELEAAGDIAVRGDVARATEAQDAFQRVLAADPDLWEAHFGIGLLARHRGDAAAAERAFRRVLELIPDQPEALHELGVALVMTDRPAEAAPMLERAARLRPQDPGHLADAGFARMRAGDLAAARAYLDRAIALGPDDPVTSRYLEDLRRAEAAKPKLN